MPRLFNIIPLLFAASVAQAATSGRVAAAGDEPYLVVPFFGKCIAVAEVLAELNAGKKIERPTTIHEALGSVLPVLPELGGGHDAPKARTTTAKEYLLTLIEFEDKAEEKDFLGWIKQSKLDSEQAIVFTKPYEKKSDGFALITKRLCTALPQDFFRPLKQRFG